MAEEKVNILIIGAGKRGTALIESFLRFGIATFSFLLDFLLC